MRNENEFWGYYEKMRPEQIELVFDENPIAYIPWGAIEYHSYHNPIGLDGIKAHGLCTDLAKEVGGLVMPPIYLAANLIKSYPGVEFPLHSLEFSEGLIRQMCKEYLEQLALQKFKIIVLLTGHAGEPHLDILREEAYIFNKKHKDKFCWYLAEFDVLPESVLKANHSALGETALQLVYNSSLVKLNNLPQDREITLVNDGIAGIDPRRATIEHGKHIVNLFVKNAGKKMAELKVKMNFK